MKILAVEFSSEQRSVAVVESSKVLGSTSEKGGRSTRAFGLIEEILRKARIEREEIECIAVGTGPGSYTGIRAAIALAQGWQLAREVKLVGISSVECLAAQAFANGIRGRANFIVDAQRNEFYLQAWDLGAQTVQPVAAATLVTWEEVQTCWKKKAADRLRFVSDDVLL